MHGDPVHRGEPTPVLNNRGHLEPCLFLAAQVDPFVDEVYDYCEDQGLAIDTLIHESGPAQMEINLFHGEPLELADQAFLFKRTVREVALRHNMFATFMAKPMAEQPGSSSAGLPSIFT